MTRLIGLFFALLLIPGPGSAAGPALVDTDFVAAALDRGAILWDVRSQDEYRRGHLPGAVNIDDVQAVLREPATEDYIALEEIERLLGEAGIDPAREIVLYGAKAHTGPYFAHVTLRWLGAENAHVYHGGIDDWKAAGKALSTDAVRLPPVAFKAKINPALLVSTRELLAKLGDPNVQIIDVRSPREYKGEDIRALRGGHVPGARNIPYEFNWVDPDTPRKLARRLVTTKDGMSLKPRQELVRLYGALDPEKETIVYCQSGVRAAQTATILADLGFRNVRVYDASWLGYGNAFDAPAENVTYFNVARVTNQLNALQARVEELEAELEQLKASREKKP
ncbi:MAG TPA: sulfurtransferase [Burkholderiales bacterium]|jgi:thiosulfate/3-mercaptopyruvate sulfurtransferase|nr:sulfurtransferase [Burkholderiales bacterium]